METDSYFGRSELADGEASAWNYSHNFFCVYVVLYRNPVWPRLWNSTNSKTQHPRPCNTTREPGNWPLALRALSLEPLRGSEGLRK